MTEPSIYDICFIFAMIVAIIYGMINLAWILIKRLFGHRFENQKRIKNKLFKPY